MPRLITRHTNRKLYDPTARRYVSLANIADLVIGGESVRVVEHPSGLDATPRILAQALVDLIKRRAQSLPGGLMETLVRLAGGARPLAPAETSAQIKGFARRARQEAETIATRLVTRGRLGIEEALHLRKEVEGAIHRGVQAAETATRKPIDALRPGRAARTIAGLARELKALETMVATPVARPTPLARPVPEKKQAGRRKKPSHTPRS
jgi:polyhydroxyalkanoate synthesis regulator protein